MPSYVITLLASGSPDELEQVMDQHRAHLRDLHAQGRLRAAGEFPDGEGFLQIFEARDRMEAESIARLSPLVDAGLVAWMLREWVPTEFD